MDYDENYDSDYENDFLENNEENRRMLDNDLDLYFLKNNFESEEFINYEDIFNFQFQDDFIKYDPEDIQNLIINKVNEDADLYKELLLSSYLYLLLENGLHLDYVKKNIKYLKLDDIKHFINKIFDINNPYHRNGVSAGYYRNNYESILPNLSKILSNTDIIKLYNNTKNRYKYMTDRYTDDPKDYFYTITQFLKFFEKIVKIKLFESTKFSEKLPDELNDNIKNMINFGSKKPKKPKKSKKIKSIKY